MSGIDILHKAMGADDIHRYLPHCPVVIYSDLHKVSNIDDILSADGYCILLYLSSQSYGHYVSICKHGAGIYSFADPYGFTPDSEHRFTPPHLRVLLHETKPEILRLLQRPGHRVYFNDICIQGSGVATCGRHAIVRILNRHIIDPSDYATKLLELEHQTGISPDNLVCAICLQ